MCRDPAANYHLKWKNNRRTITIYPHGDDDIRVNCHNGQDYAQVKDWVRSQLGITWKPTLRKPKANPPFKVCNQFFGETLKVCRDNREITIDHLSLLINDLRPTNEPIKIWARWYGGEFGFDPAVIEEVISAFKHRTYTADERAKILGVTYAQRQRLGLRRTGAVDVDKEGRERARRDRGNAYARLKRAVEKEERKQSITASNGKRRGEPLRAVNRCLPSLEVVVSTSNKSESQEIIPESQNQRLRASKIIKTDPKKWSSRRQHPPTPFPITERIALMQQYCGLSRAEAESEAMKWLS
jgi:hypothetical protein